MAGQGAGGAQGPDNRPDNRRRTRAGAQAGQYTGNYLVLLNPDDLDAGMQALQSGAGISAADRADAGDAAATSEMLAEGVSVVFDEIGVAVVSAAPDQRQALMRSAAAAPQVLTIERERVVHAFDQTLSTDYLRGYRDGIDSLVSGALGEQGSVAVRRLSRAFDESLATWGIQAIRALESPWTGLDIRVCVLDTGVDVAHPDLADRVVLAESFIAGELEDGHGHGTHCVGTAFGPKEPQTMPRYGVAGGAEVYVGKVLSDAGSGSDRGILAGINWAITQGCRVISMSLGAATQVGDSYSRVYESVALRAMRRNTLIVAAAGNESERPDIVNPVGHPANCPSILAVAALDSDLQVASFSNAGLNPDGGQVDIAAPGVDVYSTWPDDSYRRLNGTSMATPHVAGVVGQLCEAFPDATAAEIKGHLLAGALRLPLPATDVGAGLVQAPRS